jgi:hypothetical protein
MKRFILCLIAFAFVATFASAQAQRIGSLAEVEKANADFFVTSIVGMTDNKQKDTPLYEQYAGMLKSSVMVFTTKKDSVLVILGFARKATDNPTVFLTYCNMFGYAFTRGLEKVKDDTKFIIIAAQQPNGTSYDYFFPKASFDALLAGSIQVTDFEQEAYVATGSAMND